MLSKKHRSVSDLEVKRIVLEGRSYSNAFFRVFVSPSEAAFSRFSVMVTKKVEKLAVKRNSISRSVLEFVRLRYATFGRGVDVVIMVKSGALGLQFDELSRSLAQVFVRLGLDVKDE
jgi:ribonuclease P protein component